MLEKSLLLRFLVSHVEEREREKAAKSASRGLGRRPKTKKGKEKIYTSSKGKTKQHQLFINRIKQIKTPKVISRPQESTVFKKSVVKGLNQPFNKINTQPYIHVGISEPPSPNQSNTTTTLLA